MHFIQGLALLVLASSWGPAAAVRISGGGDLSARSLAQGNTSGPVVNLGKDPEALEEALVQALTLILLDHEVWCPQTNAPNPLERLRNATECCSYAFMDVGVEGGLDRITLHFTLASRFVEIQFLSDGRLEHLSPPACSSGEVDPIKKEEQGEGRSVGVDPNSKVVKQAAVAIEATLQKLCPRRGTALPTIAKVHLAQTQIVEGTNVDLIVELASGTLHRMRVTLDLDGNPTDVIRPKNPVLGDNCSLLTTSTLSPEVLEEIHALAQEQRELVEERMSHNASSFSQAASVYFNRVGGHIKELNKAVPVASVAELNSWARRDTPVDEYDVRASQKAENRRCFSVPDTAVLRQGSCGSCWAFASMGAAGDRHCLVNPESMLTTYGERRTLSVQELLSCWFPSGCDGGHGLWTYKIMTKGAKFTHTDVYPYEVRCFQEKGGVTEDWGNVGCWFFRNIPDNDPAKPCECVDQSKRPTKQPKCSKPQDALGIFTLEDFKRIPEPGSRKDAWREHHVYTNEEVVRAIQDVIYDGGPVYTGFDVYEDFQPFVRKHGGNAVYRYQSGELSGGHAVVMVGWGSAGGLDFWTLRNSWGSTWGSKGHYRHIRGINDCEIEAGVIVPIVRRVEWEHKLDFESVTLSTRLERDGAFSVFGFGKAHKIWQMVITCSGPCKPIFAVLPDVDTSDTQMAMETNEEAKCCCDYEHDYSPAKCVWIPYLDLDRKGWLASLIGTNERMCPIVDFGRGTVQSVERKDDEPCDVQRSTAAKGMPLTLHQLTEDSFRVDYDLNDHEALRGRQRVLVKARLVKVGSADSEQMLLADISENPNPTTPEKLFHLVGLDREFVLESEEYETTTVFGRRWKAREFYVLKVTARCSEACVGTARFTDLDTTHHPEGWKMTWLNRLPSKDSRTLVWSAKVEDLPPGELTLLVKVSQRGGKETVEQANVVDIPVVSKNQGAEFLPLAITEVRYKVRTEERVLRSRAHYQVVSIKCSKACRLEEFALTSRKYRISSKIGTAQEFAFKSDKAVGVEFKLGRGLPWGEIVLASVKVVDPFNGKGAERLVQMQLGVSGKCYLSDLNELD